MIALCTPSRGQVHATFYMDAVSLCLSESVRILPLVVMGSNLPAQRTSLAQAVLANKEFTHALFVDSDMRFPPDTASHLLARKLSVVGANCHQRSADLPTARKGGEWVYSTGKTGVEEVDTLGFGVMLVARGVFERVPEPWFLMPWDTKEKKVVGEDVFFCRRILEGGYRVYVDHDLSPHIRHTCEVEK